MVTRAFTCLIALLVLCQAAAAAESANERTLLAVLAPQSPPIDGRLDAAWSSGAHAQLAWDWQFARRASESTDVYALRSGDFLYVAFDATQHGGVTASQHTNDVGEGSDDEVEVLLWPSGRTGHSYRFAATPAGTRYESASENSAFRPQWLAAGGVNANGYVVTMRIPLSVLHGDGRTTWSMQFARYVQSSGAWLVWSYTPGLRYDDPSSAGSIGNMPSLAKLRARPQSRAGIYALQRIGNSRTTGAASGLGADVSIPLTATSSFVATLHPDYSNAEQDQQTIAPTAFTRRFNEVRPFFTQGASAYNNVQCVGCPSPGLTELYTPAIPTPGKGYAIEGTQGPLQFGAFDALGTGRSDSAEAITYKSPDRRFTVAQLGVQSNQPDFHDATDVVTIAHDDLRHFSEYLDYGIDRGTAVTDAGQAQRYEAGMTYRTATDTYDFEVRKWGADYNPADGIVPLSDISGYHLFANPSIVFGPTHRIQSIQLFAEVSRYAGRTGGTNLADAFALVQVNFPHQLDVQIASYSSSVRFPGDVLRPVNGSGGIEVDYRKTSATPCEIYWGPGYYGEGYLNAWQRLCGITVGRRGVLNAEVDDTDWYGGGQRLKQWLERASLTYELGSDASLSIGVRKITGAPPPVTTSLPPALTATNISLAFVRHNAHSDFYLVYGDAAALRTVPGVILKYIFYAGAQRGT